MVKAKESRRKAVKKFSHSEEHPKPLDKIVKQTLSIKLSLALQQSLLP